MKAKRSIAIGIALTLVLFTAVGFAPTPQKPVWEAHPPIHIKGGATSTIPTGYNPAQIGNAYGLNQLSATGSGQTIAIVDAYGSPTIATDLQTFNQQFGLPTANLTIAYPGKKPRTNAGWALETSLDVEWAHAIAPNANILLVVAQSASITDLVTAIDYATSHGAQVVSNSWGGSEFSSESSYESHFQHSGIVYLASTGDNGSGVSWPSSSPNVLAVGGTTLNLDANNNYLSETGWSGSGGGVSAYMSIPSYETNWTSVVGSKRGVPDVALDADPNTGVAVYDSTLYNGQSGWFQVGGTSFGAPAWAAMIALANQGRATPLTSFNAISDLYNIAGATGSAGYTTNYHDITQGSNGGYSTLPGYDLVTGIGSLKANSSIPALTQAP
ncbi:S53 family peptidase [Desulfitobacterium sp.]|uniref:S53 family peptidase n=1 Tax=Desulfitobacterium sp. TaxID=49981 RepID=UPI002D01587C|nr:S53 family peptidase [Desulfitobacterium sp.]HVJ48481.1 S53 family peptidase [Desulfitobacterium sp.]